MKVYKSRSYLQNLFLLLILFVFISGCNFAGGPIVDKKIEESVRLLDEATKEYTQVTQPLLKSTIDAKKEELAKLDEESPDYKKLSQEITSLEDTYGQGEELPNTTDALLNWTKKKKIE